MLALPLVLLAAASAAPLAPGGALPAIEGQYLTGEGAHIPGDVRGSVTLLILGFSDGSRKAVDDWKAAFDQGSAGAPRVASIEAFMIGPSNRVSRYLSLSTLRRGVSKANQRSVIVVFDPVDSWKSRVAYRGASDAYAILIDRAGVVRGVFQGHPHGDGAAAVRQAATLARKLARMP